MAVSEVVAWVRSLELGNFSEIYASRFEGTGMEWEDVFDLDDSSLAQLGVNPVHRQKLLRSVLELEAKPPAVSQNNRYPTGYRLAWLEQYGNVLNGAARERAEQEVLALQEQLAAVEDHATTVEQQASTVEDRLRDQLNQREGELEGQKEDNAALRGQNEQLQTAAAASKAKAQKLDAELALEKKNSELGDQAIHSQLAELQQELSAANERAQALSDELEAEQIAAEEAEDASGRAEKELKQRVAQLEQQLTETKEDLVAARKEAAEATLAKAAAAAASPPPAPAVCPPPHVTKSAATVEKPAGTPQSVRTGSGGLFDGFESPTSEPSTPGTPAETPQSTPAASPSATPAKQTPATPTVAKQTPATPTVATPASPTTALSPPAGSVKPAVVDDAADKQRLMQLYNEYDPKKVSKIDEILSRRPTVAERTKMWADLQHKYPNFFRSKQSTAASPANFQTPNSAAPSTTPSATPAASTPAPATPSPSPLSRSRLAGGVDDEADRAKLTALYTQLDFSKVALIDQILKKRPSPADRAKMWSDLKKKYPAYFQQATPGTQASTPAADSPAPAPAPSLFASSLSKPAAGGVFSTGGGTGMLSGGDPWPLEQEGPVTGDSADTGWEGGGDWNGGERYTEDEISMLAEMTEPGLLEEATSGLDGMMSMGESTSAPTFTGLLSNPGTSAGPLSFGNKPANSWGGAASPAPAPAPAPASSWGTRPSPALAPAPGVGTFGGQSSGLSLQPSASVTSPALGGGFGQPSALGTAGGFGQPSALGGSPATGGGFGQVASLGGSGGFGAPSTVGAAGGFGAPSTLGATSPAVGGFGAAASSGGSVFGAKAAASSGFAAAATGKPAGFGALASGGGGLFSGLGGATSPSSFSDFRG